MTQINWHYGFIALAKELICQKKEKMIEEDDLMITIEEIIVEWIAMVYRSMDDKTMDESIKKSNESK